jgi:hypothetical protein
MKIGIIEIMPKGHFTLVDSVARIYASDPVNEIYIFTNRGGEGELKKLTEEFRGRIKIITHETISIPDFLNDINRYELHKIYITTIDKYYKDFLNFIRQNRVNLFIHDIDAWFASGFLFSIYTILKYFTFTPKLAYTLKISMIYPFYRKKIISAVREKEGKFVVLTSLIKEELKKYVNANVIEVIPFSVFLKKNERKVSQIDIISVTIPGYVSQIRRDYFSLLEMIEKHLELFRDKLSFEFLGGIEETGQGRKIIRYAKKLIDKGANIILYEKERIPVEEFDSRLLSTDIILGNINIRINKYSVYGKTKDSGVIFTMIRCAKPGIILSGYEVIQELKTSSISYKNYNELKGILTDLVVNPEKLMQLKIEAYKNSLKFEPSRLYKELAINS